MKKKNINKIIAIGIASAMAISAPMNFAYADAGADEEHDYIDVHGYCDICGERFEDGNHIIDIVDIPETSESTEDKGIVIGKDEDEGIPELPEISETTEETSTSETSESTEEISTPETSEATEEISTSETIEEISTPETSESTEEISTPGT